MPELFSGVSDADALLLFTSGTTGGSKGVRLSHRSLFVQSNAKTCPPCSYDANTCMVVTTVPWFQQQGGGKNNGGRRRIVFRVLSLTLVILVIVLSVSAIHLSQQVMLQQHRQQQFSSSSAISPRPAWYPSYGMRLTLPDTILFKYGTIIRFSRHGVIDGASR